MSYTEVQPVLTGRKAELAVVERLVRRLAAGAGSLLWVGGEPGIGKSSLVSATLDTARGRNCQVFAAHAVETGGRFPLGVLLTALGIQLRSPDPDRAEIAALLVNRANTATQVSRDVTSAVAMRLIALVERACSTTPVVLAVDDLQWADPATLTVWRQLAELTGQLPLLLIGALRPAPHAADVDRMMAEPASGAEVITLGPLPEDEVAELVAQLVGARPGPELLRQTGRADGNPLYVRELVDALRRDGVLLRTGETVELADAGTDPPSLGAAIADRLSFLSATAREALSMAAILGAEFTVTHLEAFVGWTATDLEAALDEARSAGVLVESADGLMFRHILIHEALYLTLPSSLRIALHHQAARVLSDAGAAPERVAEHLLLAPEATDAWVVAWVDRWARSLTDRAAPVAVELLRRAREAAAPGAQAESIDAKLCVALYQIGGHDDEVRDLGHPLLTHAADPEIRGRLGWIVGYARLRSGRHDDALAIVERALADEALPTMWSARLQALRALVQITMGRTADVGTSVERAADAAAAAGDAFALGYALHTRSLLHYQHGNLAGVLDAADEALAMLDQEPATADLRLMLLSNRGPILDSLERPVEAERAYAEMIRAAERYASPPRLAQLRLTTAERWYANGHWDEALAELHATDATLLNRARQILRDGLLALIAIHRDDRGTAKQLLRDADDLVLLPGEESDIGRYLLVAHALAAERDGDHSAASRRMRAALIHVLADPDANEHELFFMPDLVRLALADGDRDTAAAAARACSSGGDPGEYTAGVRALVDDCRGQLDADPESLLTSAEAYLRVDQPFRRALALEGAAVLLAERGEDTRARDVAASAHDTYQTLDAAWDILRLDARLRALGIRRGPRGPRARQTTGWEALTRSELRIAREVAAGRTNSEIANELFLSRATVQSHISHILTKLGATSRLEVAREVMLRERETVSPPVAVPGTTRRTAGD
ncbi:AAA family ATPase [Dactylosporangium sucinum]|uniref:LuxR family transcriptional regulator n=1 Tax=Dactylosporangium sucinum TaxID=1424081 RepID=A0A917SZB0_9ACTN|nr:AAA family ATPase [Dactylosporangium sucinum]GGM03537.1 LuxR family transcriptional regulator [Dactylosporangium sucinum]